MRSDVGQMHLGTYFSTQTQARCIQALLSKFLSNFKPYLTVELHRLFWRQRFCFRSYQGLRNHFQIIPFSSLIRYFTLRRVLHWLTLYITNASSKEELRHFLIYHYITDQDPVYCFSALQEAVMLILPCCIGENIKEAIQNLMEDWQLNPKGMLCITTDSGTNMVKAAQLGEWTRLSCFGHNLHNAVNNGLATDRKIQSALAKCRNVSVVKLSLKHLFTKNSMKMLCYICSFYYACSG